MSRTNSDSSLPGAGVTHVTAKAATNPAGIPKAPARALLISDWPVSPAIIASAATLKPVTSPAMAPNGLSRFHQIDSTRMGKAADPVKARAHSTSLSGSAGTAIAKPAPTTAAKTNPARAKMSRVLSSNGSNDRPLPRSSASECPSAMSDAPAVASAAASTPAAHRYSAAAGSPAAIGKPNRIPSRANSTVANCSRPVSVAAVTVPRLISALIHSGGWPALGPEKMAKTYERMNTAIEAKVNMMVPNKTVAQPSDFRVS